MINLVGDRTYNMRGPNGRGRYIEPHILLQTQIDIMWHYPSGPHPQSYPPQPSFGTAHGNQNPGYASAQSGADLLQLVGELISGVFGQLAGAPAAEQRLPFQTRSFLASPHTTSNLATTPDQELQNHDPGMHQIESDPHAEGEEAGGMGDETWNGDEYGDDYGQSHLEGDDQHAWEPNGGEEEGHGYEDGYDGDMDSNNYHDPHHPYY
jgi:hypothetical protein